MAEKKDSIFTTQYFEELEKSSCIGIKGEFKKGDNVETLYDSEKKIYVVHRIKNKKETTIMKPCAPNWKSLLVSKKPDPIAMFNSETGKAYTEKKGSVDLSKICSSRHIMVKIGDDKDMKECFEKRQSDFNEICDFFKLDKEKTLNHEVVIARLLAYESLSVICGAEHVDEDEETIIDGSIRGALTYFKKGGIIHNCFSYDVNGLYPYCMAKTNFRFPLTTPVKKTIKSQKIKIQPHKRLEIYKLKILGTHKYWKNTKDDFYNTYHIAILNLLGLDYNIVGDTKWVYEDTLKSSKYFKYFSDLYDLKTNNGNKFAKAVMSSTWGALSREKSFEIPLGEVFDQNLYAIQEINLRKGTVILQKSSRKYKHRTARIKTFLLAYARYFMLKRIVKPLENAGHDVFLVNTDSVTTNATKEEMDAIFPIGDEMGDLKVEKEYDGYYYIHHLRSVTNNPFDENGLKFDNEDEMDDELETIFDDWDEDDE